MLLEIRGFSSSELYDTIIPKLEAADFKEVSHWADPETDGELMGFQYEYIGEKELSFEDLIKLIKEIKSVPIKSALIPDYKFYIIKKGK